MRDMTFGEWFRTERERRGWQQSWVARRVGVSRSQMNNIEAGRSRAGAETMQALYALFGVTPEDVQQAQCRDELTEALEHIERQHHPGVETLAKDSELRRRWRITDAEVEELRDMVLRVPLDTVELALVALQFIRTRMVLDGPDDT